MLSQIKNRILAKVGINKPQVKELDQQAWDELYNKGKWDYLDQLSELAHYSVILGYTQHVLNQGNILDVGCGHGVLQQKLATLAYSQYTGIDISQAAINRASKYSDQRTRFIATDASNYHDQSLYDVIIFNESLYCFNDCLAVLKHYEQLLRPGGHFVVSMHIQEVSLSHWNLIEKTYKQLDAVKITNMEDISWKCSLIQPNK